MIGPRHGAMSRIDLGLLIREAGNNLADILIRGLGWITPCYFIRTILTNVFFLSSGPAHRHYILLAVSSLVLQTLHQESMTQKRSGVSLCTEGAVADTDAVTGARDDRYEDVVISNINNVKSTSSHSSAVMHKVHARIGEYLPIIDALVTCSGVENIPHVREEHYSRISEGLNADEKKVFDDEFHSNTKRVLEMLLFQRKNSSASGIDNAESCQDQDGTGNPHSVNKDIPTAHYSGNDGDDDVVDAALENIPSILMAAENLLEAIAVFDLAECDSEPYLLNGAAIQKLLKNIPWGDAFSDVRYVRTLFTSFIYRHVSGLLITNYFM